MNESLNNATQAIDGLINDLHDRPRLFDVKSLDSRSLIIWEKILFFWNADAIVRLMANGKEPVREQWLSAYNAAVYLCRHLNKIILAGLLNATGDYSGITGLTILYLDKIEAQKEINQRINEIFTLKNFLKHIDHPEEAKDFDNFTAHVINIYNRSARALGRRKMDWADNRKLDYQQEIGAQYYADYKMLQQEVDQGLPVTYIRNPVAEGKPLIMWDMIAPDIWKKEIIESLKYLSPLDEKEAEKWKDKHSILLDIMRKLADKRLIKFDEKYLAKKNKKNNKQDDIYIEDIQKKHTENKETNLSLDIGLFKRGGKRHDTEEDAIILKIALEKVIEGIYNNTKKPDQILEALTLHINGMPLIDAAKEKGISYSSVKNYWSEIKAIRMK